jgi:hypothetical protein
LTFIGSCLVVCYRVSVSGVTVAWWWVALTCIEVGWVLGVGLLLRDTDPPRAGAEGASAAGGAVESCRGAFVWGYFLYHLPLLLADYLTTGWPASMLEGRGVWLLAQAAILGAATVAVYGTALTWFLA